MRHFPVKLLLRQYIVVLIIFVSENILACTSDVTILEGTTISFCQGQGGTINASAGFVSYAWTGPQTGMNSSMTPNQSGQYIVTAMDDLGCVSSDTIYVTINSNPIAVIFSSEGSQICQGGNGTTLSLTQAFASYQWDTGSNASSIQISQGGTYTIQVVDFNGCTGNSSITISQPIFTLTNASNSSVCNGSSLNLSANGGTSYSWSTGETNSTIVVSPSVETNYSVTISNGNCTETLSQLITVEEMPISSITDTFYIASGDNVFINGPDGYTSYNWAPQQDLSTYSSQGAIFSGSQTTNYTIISSNSNGCIRTDSVIVIVIALTIPTGFSPNGDYVNDAFEIPELTKYKAKLVVFNRWGDKVYENDHYQNDWNGTCQTPFCLGSGTLPEGTYFYSIDIEKVHFDGYTTIKRQL